MDWLNPMEPRITTVEGGALAALLLALAIVLVTAGCSKPQTPWQKECREAREAVKATWLQRINVTDADWRFGALRDPTDDGWPSAPKPYEPPGGPSRPEDALPGQEGGQGLAVLIADDAAYWVCKGKVYAANGIAGTWSRGIPRAPVGIHFDSVKRAVESGQAR